MQAVIRVADRLPPVKPVAPRPLLDRWFERWAERADALWRRAGDPHHGRYY